MAVTTDPKGTATRRRRRTAENPPPPAEPSPGISEGEPEGASPRAAKPPRPRAGSLQRRLEEWIGALAIPYATVGDQYAAELIANRAPKMAEAWADLAAQNAGVKRVLERMMQGTAWGAVIASSASLALPLLAHHGILPLPVDPFAAMYGGESVIPVRGMAAPRMPGWANAPQPPQAPTQPPVDTDMTPPIAPDAPPGTFTVAGSASRATTAPGSE